MNRFQLVKKFNFFSSPLSHIIKMSEDGTVINFKGKKIVYEEKNVVESKVCYKYYKRLTVV